MEWRDYVKDTLVKLKQKNPGATLKDAMIASQEPYRRMKDNLYRIRGGLVEGRRDLAKMGIAKKKNNKDANRIEIIRYADVLRDMGYEGFDYTFDGGFSSSSGGIKEGGSIFYPD